MRSPVLKSLLRLPPIRAPNTNCAFVILSVLSSILFEMRLILPPPNAAIVIFPVEAYGVLMVTASPSKPMLPPTVTSV